VKGHRTKPLSKRALHTCANGSYRAIPVVELIQQAEREAKERAQALARPLDVNALAAKWGAQMVTR